MPTPLRVLILEDQLDDAELMLRELRREGFSPTWHCVQAESEYLTRLQEGCDLILADYTLPQFDALRALHLAQDRALDIPFIIVSGSISEEVAVECMKQGAADYLLKDRLVRLGPAVTQALRAHQLRDEKRRAEAAFREEAQVSAALALVGRELMASFGTATILNRLCQLTTEVLACECSYVFFWHPQTDELVPVASAGETLERWEALQILRFPRLMFTNLTPCRNNREEVGRLETCPPPALSGQLWTATGLWAALRRGDELLGVLAAGYRQQPAPVTLLQQRILQGVAQMASLALENARLLEELERASRLKSDFLATMSHELRTPLHIILGYTDLLVEEEFGCVTSEQVLPLQKIDANARELLNLITATLDVSRLEAGRLPIELGEVDVGQLLRELQQETERSQQYPQLYFQWQIAPRLPRLHTDWTKLKVVLKNLLGNAIKFTERGCIGVNVSPRAGGVEFCVSDTGVGIAPEMQPVIFEMFRQVDSSPTRHHGGVGLGLYIVKRFMDLLGGSVSVESEQGRGSTFRVWVPGDRRVLERELRPVFGLQV